MSLKQTIKRLFPELVAYRNRVHNYLAHYRFRHLPIDQVFELIHKENHWKDAESLSGTGSNKENSEAVLDIVSNFIETLKIKSLLDIPCGDFNWMKDVDLKDVNYLGADIVTGLVVNNHENYGTETVKFLRLNIIESVLPTVDLIFCRDCLVHFSYQDIQRAIESVKKSQSTYLMTTTFPAHRNHDIITGNWRPINLQGSPFNFPAPMNIYNEVCIEDERYADKSLAVWRIADL
jgi:hypothetical protein